MNDDILSRIANGDLHTTPEYSASQVPESDYQANRQRFKELCQILELIDEKYVTGDKDDSKEQPYYTNLRLTESGQEFLRFGSLTLKDIDNSYGKDSLKEWLGKPLVLEVCKYLVIALLVFVGSVYSSEIKDIFTSSKSAPVEEKKIEPPKESTTEKHMN